jgi:murein DD-endopeptidase MepM/ murein hydrolase activator NlpD
LVNDRHPSGTATSPAPASEAASASYAPYGGEEARYGEFTPYGDPSAASYPTAATTGASGGQQSVPFGSDPLFGDFPGTGAYGTAQWTDAGQTYGTDLHHLPPYDPYAAPQQSLYDSGAHDATAWTDGYQHLSGIPAQGSSPEATGQWNAQAWQQAEQSDGAGATQQWAWGTQTFDSGVYDATQWNGGAGTGAQEQHEGLAPEDAPAADPFDQQATAAFESADPFDHPATAVFEAAEPFDHAATAVVEQAVPFDQQATATFESFESFEEFGAAGPDDGEDVPPLLDGQEEAAPAPLTRTAARAAARSRRRAPAKRSALLTVAVPSVCVIGVASVAAATVDFGGDDGKETTAAGSSEATAVKPVAANNKLDTQLKSLSAGADDFADRASRTQERIDLKAQQAAEKKKAAQEAARKERLRPKFVLPVTQKGLSAYFGQAGVNWMSVHTGIDFPVSFGTTVMAATDGTVRTQWNSAYGNMAIVTAKDGTETWYCHLSSYRVASGTTVKAGQPIAYSGSSGNSTGPHLHFEVRPGGGSAIDPLPWLRSHGLDPT